jgi:hypothetical protein
MENKFWKKVLKTKGCWFWTGAKHPEGYGNFGVYLGVGQYRTKKAHRIAWELIHGPIPKDMSVLHKCDTPECVNHDHLFLGTAKDNIEDRIRKGRFPFQERERDALGRFTRIIS